MRPAASAFVLLAFLSIASTASAAWKVEVNDIETNESKTFKYEAAKAESTKDLPVPKVKGAKCKVSTDHFEKPSHTADTLTITCWKPDQLGMTLNAVRIWHNAAGVAQKTEPMFALDNASSTRTKANGYQIVMTWE